jgi:hypothetical protein
MTKDFNAKAQRRKGAGGRHKTKAKAETQQRNAEKIGSRNITESRGSSRKEWMEDGGWRTQTKRQMERRQTKFSTKFGEVGLSGG